MHDNITEVITKLLQSVDVPPDKVSYGESFMEVESVKSVAEINAPVNGKIVAVNEDLDSAPELINQDAEGTWIVEVELDGDVPADLMSKEDYEKTIK